MQQQKVTLSFFRFSGAANRWWAFGMMGKAPGLIRELPGSPFAKMMGSGGGSGFSIFPNLGISCLIHAPAPAAPATPPAPAPAPAAQTRFIASPSPDFQDSDPMQDHPSPDFQDSDPMQDHPQFTPPSAQTRLIPPPAQTRLIASLQAKCAEHLTLTLQPIKSDGKWDGTNPFQSDPDFDPAGRPIAILTRATIRPSRLIRFWRSVPNSSEMILRQPGHLFSIGVGELPLIQQATFSLWENLDAVKRYAYREGPHKKVVQQTRKYDWYSEELFARFVVTGMEGTWGGLEKTLAASLQQ